MSPDTAAASWKLLEAADEKVRASALKLLEAEEKKAKAIASERLRLSNVTELAGKQTEGAAPITATPRQKMSPLELRRIMPLKEAAKLTGMSVDTLRRHHRDKIRRLSPRRLGMCVADALQI
jgi:hypothetical protein